MVDTWEPDSRGHPRPGKGKPETFDIQGLVSGRTRVKILVRCAAPSSNQNLGAVRLSCHSPCLSVGRCTAPSKGIKNLPRSPAGPCKAIPSLLCRLSVSVDLAPEGQFNPRSRKKRKIALKQVCRKSVLLQARNRRKKLPGPVRVYVGVPLPPGHLQGQGSTCSCSRACWL